LRPSRYLVVIGADEMESAHGFYIPEDIGKYLILCGWHARQLPRRLLIGERTAEAIKMEIGSAHPLDKPLTMEIKGRNLIEGVPKTLTIGDSEIREALGECVATIVNAIRVALERTPPELSADISDRGIVLTGGGGLLKNLDKRIREETGLPVSIADDPLASVVLGTGRMLSDFRLLRKISID
jgi:rod shape-determining protein MreB